MEKVFDKFGNELKAGDTVCFVQHISRGSVVMFKATVEDVKVIPSKYEYEPDGKYVFLDEGSVIPENIYSIKIPKRKSADLVVKCY